MYLAGIPSEDELKKASMIALELKGLSAWMRNENPEAERLMREATQLEDNVGYFFGPPDIVKPTHELFGEFLLATDRPHDAYAQFESALQRAPNRILSLRGQLNAAKQTKDMKKVDELEKKLDELLKNADEKVKKNS